MMISVVTLSSCSIHWIVPNPLHLFNCVQGRACVRQIGANKWLAAIPSKQARHRSRRSREAPLASPIPHPSHRYITISSSQLVRAVNRKVANTHLFELCLNVYLHLYLRCAVGSMMLLSCLFICRTRLVHMFSTLNAYILIRKFWNRQAPLPFWRKIPKYSQFFF